MSWITGKSGSDKTASNPGVTKAEVKQALRTSPLSEYASPQQPTKANIPNSKQTAVQNREGQVFAVNQDKKKGNGVYEATDFSGRKPNSNVVMKVTQQKPGESTVDRLKASRKQDDIHKKVGLSAGDSITFIDKPKAETYTPMKKVQGNSLSSELQKGANDPTKIASKTLLANARAEVNRVNKLGVQHGNMNADNMLVTKGKATAVSYGKADFVEKGQKNGDMSQLNSSLREVYTKMPLSRQASFNNAMRDHLRITGQ